MHINYFRFLLRRPSAVFLSSRTVRLYSTAVTTPIISVPQKTSEPLRILFCGSDSFSISSLESLYREREQNPELIESIDVLVRPAKPAGRNLRAVKEVPLRSAAVDLGLRVHERDTFTGWNVPSAEGGPINLIIAVSFGLFVPPRVLRSAKYGGLNVHPSLLPNYRGPAPLQHMIMRGEKTIGVTLQTMDEQSFDHGQILAQEEIPLPFIKTPTYAQLLSFVRPLAADILTQGLRNRVFVPPLPKIQAIEAPQNLIHAGKITSADREVVWGELSSENLERKFRALGRLWSNLCIEAVTPPNTQRVTFQNCEVISTPPSLAQWIRDAEIAPIMKSIPRSIGGLVNFFVQKRAGPGAATAQPYIVAEDGKAIILTNLNGANLSLRVEEITAAGKETQPAAKAIRAYDGTEAWDILKLPHKLIARPKSRRAFKGSGRTGARDSAVKRAYIPK